MLSIALTVVVAVVLGHALMLFIIGRSRDQPSSPDPADRLFFVFVVPCLDEHLVIERTVRQLLRWRGPNSAVLVVDDGSEDGTGDIVAAIDDPRVWLLRRRPPHARRGKGEALNAAYRRLMGDERLGAYDAEDIVVGVVDADGRLDPDAYGPLSRCFGDPGVAAVQIRVRIHNAPDTLLARLQDVEFAVFTEVFQRGRARLGTAGMGGNGQFVRLSALAELGGSPWSACLTEDLELGVELVLRGGLTAYCADTWVSQQGVVETSALMRQRSRWFQGHLQCWRLVPAVRACPHLSRAARRDLLFHLLAPALLLGVSLVVALGWLAAFGLLATGAAGGGLPRPADAITMYLLGFGLVPLVAAAYGRAEPAMSGLRLVLLAHLYLVYSLLWAAAGWRAVWRLARGRRRWAKTWRTTGTGDEPLPAPVPALLPAPPALASPARPLSDAWPVRTGPMTAEGRETVCADARREVVASAGSGSSWPVPSWRRASAA